MNPIRKLTAKRMSLLLDLIENLPIAGTKAIQQAIYTSDSFLEDLEKLAYSLPDTDENIQAYRHCYNLIASTTFELQHQFINS
jgi:recombinational DNA repair protein RecR